MKRLRRALVFEQPQPGVEIDFAGMDEEEAIAYVQRMNETLPPHPSTINYGTGPAPQRMPGDEETIPRCLRAMVSEIATGGLSSARIQYARQIGAWWYWSYACNRSVAEMREQYGHRADDLIYGDDRRPMQEHRADVVEWMIDQLF